VAKGSQKIAWTKKRVLITTVVVVFAVLVVAAAAVYYLVYVLKPQQQSNGQYNPFSQQVQDLLNQPVPDDPLQKALFYAQVAQNYDNLNEYNYALTYYLKAQSVIDQNKLGDQIVYYQAIATDYQATGDRTNARVYLQLYLKNLQQYLNQHPNDEATQEAIKSAQERLQKI